jgi:hypothetical protein
MINRGQLILGIVLVVLGVLFLLGTLFDVNVGAICWPAGLIVLGVWLVLRPSLTGPGTASDVVLLGELRRRGRWAARNEEIWLGIGDADIDFSEADIPSGETRVQIFCFVGDVDVFVPAGVGAAVHVGGFVVDSVLFGRDYETFLSPVDVTGEDYAAAERRVRVEMTGFVCDLKVKQAG